VGPARFAQRDEAADDEADDEVQQHAPGIAAEFPDVHGMRTQPFDQPRTDDRSIPLRQPGCSPQGQELARVFDDFGHFCEEPGQPAFGPQVEDHGGGDSTQSAEDGQRDQGYHQHLGPVVVEASDDESRRQHVHQLHHQQARQQGREQVESQSEQQSDRHHQPGGDLIAGCRGKNAEVGHGGTVPIKTSRGKRLEGKFAGPRFFRGGTVSGTTPAKPTRTSRGRTMSWAGCEGGTHISA